MCVACTGAEGALVPGCCIDCSEVDSIRHCVPLRLKRIDLNGHLRKPKKVSEQVGVGGSGRVCVNNITNK